MTSQVWPSSDDFADGASAYGTGVRRYLRVRPMFSWGDISFYVPGGFGILPADRGGELRRYWFDGVEPAVGSPEYAAGFAGYGPNKITHGVVAAIVERQIYIADGEVTMVPRVKVISGPDGHLIQHFVGVCGRVQNGLLNINGSDQPNDQYIYRPDGYYFLQLRDRGTTAEPVLSLFRVVSATWTELATAPLSDHDTYTWGTPDGGAPRRMRMVIENEGGGARIRCYRSAPLAPGSFVAQAERLVFNVFDTPSEAITTAGRWGCAGAQATDNTGAAGEYRGIVLVESLRIKNAAGTELHLRDLWHRTHGSSKRHIDHATASGLNYESRSLSSAYTGDMLGQPTITSPTFIKAHYGHLIAATNKLVIGPDPSIVYTGGGVGQRHGWYFDQNPAQSVQQHRSATVTFISTATVARETRHFGLHLRASGFSNSQVRGKDGQEILQEGNNWKGGYRAVIKYEYVGGATDTFTLTVHAHLPTGSGSGIALVLATADITALVALGTQFKFGLEVQDFDQGGGNAVGIMCRIDNTDVVLTLGGVSGVTSEAGWLVDRRTEATIEGLAVGMYCNFGPPVAAYLASGVIYIHEFATEAISSSVGPQLPPIANPDPGAGNPDITVDAGQPVTIAVLQNDEVFNGATADVATVTNTFQPGQGSAVVNANGTITYTAPAGPGGFSDSWRYRFSDSNGLTADPALITVNVNTSLVPTLVGDTATVESGAAVPIDVLANDTSYNGSTWAASNPVTIVTPPSNATAVAHATTGVVTFTSDIGATAQDETFTYTATDSNGMVSAVALVRVTVTASGGTGPVANPDFSATSSGQNVDIDVLANDTPGGSPINPATVIVEVFPAPQGSTTVLPSGEIRYTAPSTVSNFWDFFFYTVKDNLGVESNPAQVFVDVTGTGQVTPPTANPDEFTAVRGTTVLYDVTANDSAPTGWEIDPESIANITSISGSGTLTVATGGNVQFVSSVLDPAPADAVFTYTVGATNGLTSAAALIRVHVVVGGSGQLPDAVQDNATVIAGQAVEIPVTLNDAAYNGAAIDPSSVTLVGAGPTKGTAVIGPTDGWVTYTADASPISTSDSFTYTVSDDAAIPLTSDPGTVLVTITGTNPNAQNPTANNDIAQVVSGQSTLISILANDKAYDGATIDPATVALTTGGLTPGATANYASGTGLVTFTSAANSPAGIQTFSYTVEDSNGWISNTATVTVYITSGGASDPDSQPSVPLSAETAGKTGTLTTPASWPISEERIVGINSVTFDTGHRATMPVLPKERRMFEVQMLGATHAERATLSAFFLAHRGTEIPFDWVHPLTSETIAVRFASPSIAAKHRSGVGEGVEDYRFDLIEVFDAGTYGA